MKVYTLRIVYNETTGELESLEEKILDKEEPVAIEASPKVMEAFAEANLIGEVLMLYPGVTIGET
tara:strand:- start:372 stop:566 length:195 start_codon:yes stop_codon:yes gene_type:complete